MNELNSLKENKGIEENTLSTQGGERLNELLKAYSLDELAEFTKRGIAIVEPQEAVDGFFRMLESFSER